MKTMKTNATISKMVMTLAVAELSAHALNRDFPREGERWAEFVESVRKAGEVRVPLHVRELPDESYQILAGHRRAAAAEQCGITEVMCIVYQGMDDVEALSFLVNENLQREDLSPVDEARQVAAMRDEMGLAAEEIARRISKSVEWVRTRQMMLALGDEDLLRRVALPKNEDLHVTMGAVEAILECPEDLRPRAVQMVIFPALEEFSLKERQAREVLRKHLIEPRQRELAWDGGLPKVVEVWRKRLKKDVGKDGAEGLMVRGIPWADHEAEGRGCVDAEDLVAEVEKAEGAPVNLRWLDVALRHGLAVKVVPGADEETSRAVVDARLLRTGEEALAEHGQKAWLVAADKRGVRSEKTPPSRTQQALAVLEGEGEIVYQEDDERTEGPPSEGKLEQWAWVDLRLVRYLGKLAVAAETNAEISSEHLPEDAPEWAREMATGGRWHWMADVCEWFLTLRKSAE